MPQSLPQRSQRTQRATRREVGCQVATEPGSDLAPFPWLILTDYIPVPIASSLAPTSMEPNKNKTLPITQFDPVFAARLPEARSILETAHLVVHSAVTQITLHGSRGLVQNPRPDSDIDLSLLFDTPTPPPIDASLEAKLHAALQLTLSNWRSPIEPDLAAIFPLHPCGLACFNSTAYETALCPTPCPTPGIDCFGVYKIQKGFTGFVLNAGLQVALMYPCITVWRATRDL